MVRVLITQSGLVHVVLVAPAIMALNMWSEKTCVDSDAAASEPLLE